MRASTLRTGFTALALTAALATSAHAACSCTGMTIHRGGAPFAVCSNANLQDFVTTNECAREAGSNANGCAGYAYRYACATGANTLTAADQPYQHTGFGVEATIVGNPNDCRPGHALQQKITGRGTSKNSALHAHPTGDVDIGNLRVTIKGGNGTMPEIGAMSNNRQEFGADNYTDVAAQDVLIEGGNRIKWWDNPDQTKDRRNENATWQFRYFSYVLGSGGGQSCGCVFKIDVDWQRLQNPVTTYTADAASPACAF